MTVGRPLYLDGITNYTADEFRTLIDAIYGTPGVRLDATGAGCLVSPTGPVSMAVQVATGLVAVPAKSAANGKYLLEVTAPETVTIAAASAQNRIDIIVAQVLDTAFSDPSSIGQIVPIQGTPSGTPVAPATPSNAVLLATVAVNTGAATIVAGNITDKRVPIVSAGRLVPAPFANGAARDALITSPVAGELVQLTSPPIFAARTPDGVSWQQVLLGDSRTQMTFVPSAATLSPATGTATWVTLGNITVPAWANKARCVITINGISNSTAASQATLALKIGTATGSGRRLANQTTTTRFGWGAVDYLTSVPTGSQSVLIQASALAGGQFSADTGATFDVAFDFSL